ncbi:GDSL esterase/lipase At4g16230 [Selaginella moellendorffii]|uniref:GDSL esterase/lipase At4g16230 n=1 Tax=Selaginella moellendorffii TaxID=88036 RepID=UPI000D1C628E|nr:GDSL esterase/lipase At4g16230 [Selaginella moellendorffii]|eukprot:XP_024519903.1 GDSL esterase/lipase At4g16230 [Selaginella moellendorffii]
MEMLRNCKGLIHRLALFLVIAARIAAADSSGKPVVPALFILGDSTVDCGNNNWLWTVAQSKFLPYGRDFDTHEPTGRFTNGRLSIDYLGVNFASAGSGILNATGSIFGQRIPMQTQLAYLKDVKSELSEKFGQEQTNEIFSKSIFYVSVGSNDFINNYLVPGSSYLRDYNRKSFIDLLISGLDEQLNELYSIGARRIVVASLSPLGSVPSQLAKFSTIRLDGSSFLNDMSQQYNTKLFDLLVRLRSSLSEADVIYNSLYNVLMDISGKYSQYGTRKTTPAFLLFDRSLSTFQGFLYNDTACCGLGNFNGSVPCLPNVPVCEDAAQYVFWDEYHPTGSTYKLIADKLWSGNINESYPINVKTLLGL